jgi:anti-sigma28 factor (negative regulator of flagellin synthesis)
MNLNKKTVYASPSREQISFFELFFDVKYFEVIIMKITSTNNMRYPYLKPEESTKMHSAPANSSKISKSFDEVNILSGTSSYSEDVFMKELSGKISLEVRQASNSKKLEEISHQIETSSYTINLDEVAQKILLL